MKNTTLPIELLINTNITGNAIRLFGMKNYNMAEILQLLKWNRTTYYRALNNLKENGYSLTTNDKIVQPEVLNEVLEVITPVVKTARITLNEFFEGVKVKHPFLDEKAVDALANFLTTEIELTYMDEMKDNTKDYVNSQFEENTSTGFKKLILIK